MEETVKGWSGRVRRRWKAEEGGESCWSRLNGWSRGGGGFGSLREADERLEPLQIRTMAADGAEVQVVGAERLRRRC